MIQGGQTHSPQRTPIGEYAFDGYIPLFSITGEMSACVFLVGELGNDTQVRILTGQIQRILVRKDTQTSIYEVAQLTIHLLQN